MSEVINQYYKEIEKVYKTGSATEHSYRPALISLIKSINSHVEPINETKLTSAGRPDIMIRKGDITVGVFEAKDLTESLDKTDFSEQLNRYLEAFNNFCFSNELEFRFYKEKKLVNTVSIAQIINGKLIPNESSFDKLEELLRNFLSYKGEIIKSSKRLAEIMAGKARLLNASILQVMNNNEDQNESNLRAQYEAFKTALVHDITVEAFSDMYSQTIVYGLFVARLHDNTPEDFSREEAERLIPKSNPFLKDLFHYVAYDLEDSIKWIIDDLVEIYSHSDLNNILSDFGKTTQRNDPVVHFYEDFLGLYNKDTKKSRGVYYTPEPVVNFIIRGIDYLLKTEFNIAEGISSTQKTEVERKSQNKMIKRQEHTVQILDIATGTGTFLNEIIKYIYNTSNYSSPAIWSKYVEEHLIPRLFGFELLMAPYTMAHLKLGLTLKETGYKDEGQKRLNVILTNTLEEPDEHSQSLFVQSFAREAEMANDIKRDAPIMVITGNPPYSISSSNKGAWILDILNDYKKGLNEKKINLDDDYIKFIRYAQYLIDKNRQGVIGMITNNSYIDGVTHRQMRKTLLESFDKIYIYDLHGNARKKEVSPDGSKDENVFDIMQGVSIIFAVKTSNRKSEEAQVFHYDSRGKREVKYDKLRENGIENIEWTEINPDKEYHFFVPKDFGKQKKYNKGIALDELFEVHSAGVKTKVDKIAIDFDNNSLATRIDKISNLSKQQIIEQFEIASNTTREYLKKDPIKFDDKKIIPYEYRPFDNRFIYYDFDFLSRPRAETMLNFLNKQNIGLELGRTQYLMVFSGKYISDEHYAGQGSFKFPLYLYEDEKSLEIGQKCRPNFNEALLDEIENQLGMKCNQKAKLEDTFFPQKGTEFTPLDLFDYIYAVLHAPQYRETYKEFLKIDFPRIQFDVDKEIFWTLVEKGRALRLFHLLQHPKLSEKSDIAVYSGQGDDVISKPIYKENKVYINENQYFDNVPEIARNFYIGGYQPAQHRFKDRKGRKLSFDEIVHCQKMIIALSETDRLMNEIEKIKCIK